MHQAFMTDHEENVQGMCLCPAQISFIKSAPHHQRQALLQYVPRSCKGLSVQICPVRSESLPQVQEMCTFAASIAISTRMREPCTMSALRWSAPLSDPWLMNSVIIAGGLTVPGTLPLPCCCAAELGRREASEESSLSSPSSEDESPLGLGSTTPYTQTTLGWRRQPNKSASRMSSAIAAWLTCSPKKCCFHCWLSNLRQNPVCW